MRIKDNEIFDDWQFLSLGKEFLVNEEKDVKAADSKRLYVRIIDHLDQEIVYDKALEDFEDLLEEIKKICSFYLQNTVLDYCFDSVVTTELVSTDLKEKDTPVSHLRFETKPNSQHINHEYIVHEVLKHECQFQVNKAKAIRIYTKVLNNSTDIDCFNKTKKAIRDLILWRPEFDIQGRKILTDTINELCNSKSSNSSISTKDLCKEIQNFVVTVFDHYRNSIKYLESLTCLMKEIYQEQKRVWTHTDVLADLRRRDNGVGVLKNRIRKFIDTIDNLSEIASLHTKIDDSVNLLVDSLIPLKQVDANSLTDFCIEEHRQTYFKTMQVKYTEGMSNANVVGKGIKESTCIYLLRLHLQNRLMNRTNFVKGNLRLAIVDELREAWKKSVNTLSSRLVNSKQPTFSPDFAVSVEIDPHADDQNEKLMKELHNQGMDALVKSLDDDKKNHIYTVHAYINRRGPPNFSKSKSHYSKGDWKNKVFKLNPIFGTYYFMEYQFQVKDYIAALEPLLIAIAHMQNIGLPKNRKVTASEVHLGYMFEKIFNFKEIYNMYGSSIQRLLQAKAISKFDMEDLQKRVANLGDAKFLAEYLIILTELCAKNIKCFSFQWTQYTSKVIHDIGKVIPNTTVANTLITSIGVYLDPLDTAQVVITDRDQLLITSVDNNEIILGSENESIVRRLVLQLLIDHYKDINFDLMGEIQSLKVDIANRNQGQNTQKV
jgi:hypothetical protein